MIKRPHCPLCDHALKLVHQLRITGKPKAYWVCGNVKCKKFYRMINVENEKRKQKKIDQKATEFFRQQKLFN